MGGSILPQDGCGRSIVGRLIFLQTFLIFFHGCGDMELIRRGDAFNLQVLFGRLILSLEQQSWRHIDPESGLCGRNFYPKHCSPVKFTQFAAADGGYEAVYTITVGDRCGTIKSSFQALREKPEQFTDLYDTSEPDINYLLEHSRIKTESTHRSAIRYQNMQFQHLEKSVFFTHLPSSVRTFASTVVPEDFVPFVQPILMLCLSCVENETEFAPIAGLPMWARLGSPG